MITVLLQTKGITANHTGGDGVTDQSKLWKSAGKVT